MSTNWEEFKKKEKIFVGDYDKFPNTIDVYYWLENEERYKKEFVSLTTVLEDAKISEYKISPLTNDDGEYVGCYLESVTIGNITVTGIAVDPYNRDDELQIYAKLKLRDGKDGTV